MKIASVTCEFLQVPVRIPVKETVVEYGLSLVTLRTDTGLEGYGIAREHNRQGTAVRQLVVDDIGPYLQTMEDEDLDPSTFWHKAASFMPLVDYRTPTGIVSGAISAVDQALWDLRGKELGQPVYRLLGGSQSEVDVYAAFGLNIYSQEEETEAARRLVAKGFRAFKLQGANAGVRRDVTHDAKRIAVLRDTVGDSAAIMLDGRNFNSANEAIAIGRQIEPYNVAFFDEPLFGRDPIAIQRFKQVCPTVPVATRSRGGNLWDNRDLLVTGAVDVMGTNVLDQGGFTQSIKIAHTAELFQLPIVTGGAWHLQNVHLIAAATNGWMTEYHTLAAGVSEAVFQDPIKPENGRLRLPTKPGLGLELNVDGVAEARARAAAAG